MYPFVDPHTPKRRLYDVLLNIVYSDLINLNKL